MENIYVPLIKKKKKKTIYVPHFGFAVLLTFPFLQSENEWILALWLYTVLVSYLDIFKFCILKNILSLHWVVDFSSGTLSLFSVLFW